LKKRNAQEKGLQLLKNALLQQQVAMARRKKLKYVNLARKKQSSGKDGGQV